MENEGLVMRCSKATRQLQLYIDKQLTLDQIRALEAHLSICSACREELFLLEMIEQALQSMEPIAEPPDLTDNIMRRVALSTHQTERASRERTRLSFRPSLSELLAAAALATVTTLGIIMGLPSLRPVLPAVNGHNLLSLVLINIWNMLISVNSGTLMLGFWVIGTILGVWITLILAGNEVRSTWFKAVLDRLPVW
jgi:Putative zinc-finger